MSQRTAARVADTDPPVGGAGRARNQDGHTRDVVAERVAVVFVADDFLDPQRTRTVLGETLGASGAEVIRWLEAPAARIAGRLALRAVTDGFDLVVVAGSDEAVLRCSSVVAGTACALAVIPSDLPTQVAHGGNVIAETLGLPTELVPAASVAAAGHHAVIDAGTIGRSRFAVAAVVGHVTHDPGRRRTRFTVVVDRDQRPRRWRARAVVVANSGAVVEGVSSLPDADPGDGMLDLAVIDPSSIRLLVRCWLTGHPLSDRRTRVVSVARCRGARITSNRPVPVRVDGVASGSTESLRVGLSPASLVVCVPDD